MVLSCLLSRTEQQLGRTTPSTIGKSIVHMCSVVCCPSEFSGYNKRESEGVCVVIRKKMVLPPVALGGTHPKSCSLVVKRQA